MKNIHDYLQKIGLSKIEAQLYEGLLRIGNYTTIKELSEQTGIKRITTHFNIESLIDKGLIVQTTTGSRRQIRAEQPEQLKHMLNEKKTQLRQIEKEFPTFINMMQYAIPKLVTQKNPVIKYYEGEKGFKDVCQRSLDKAGDEILFLSNLDEWYKVYTVEYDEQHYVPIRLKNKTFLKVLAFRGPITKSMPSRDEYIMRETRFLPKEYTFNSSIIIYGNEVSMMLSSRPYTAIVIEDKQFYSTFKSMFMILWEQVSEKPTEKEKYSDQ